MTGRQRVIKTRNKSRQEDEQEDNNNLEGERMLSGEDDDISFLLCLEDDIEDE